MSGSNRQLWREYVNDLCDHIEFLTSSVTENTEQEFRNLTRPKGYGVTQAMIDYVDQHEKFGCTALSVFDLINLGTGPTAIDYKQLTPEAFLAKRGWWYDHLNMCWRRNNVALKLAEEGK